MKRTAVMKEGGQAAVARPILSVSPALAQDRLFLCGGFLQEH
jgi:hypothetical protein